MFINLLNALFIETIFFFRRISLGLATPIPSPPPNGVGALEGTGAGAGGAAGRDVNGLGAGAAGAGAGAGRATAANGFGAGALGGGGGAGAGLGAGANVGVTGVFAGCPKVAGAGRGAACIVANRLVLLPATVPNIAPIPLATGVVRAVCCTDNRVCVDCVTGVIDEAKTDVDPETMGELAEGPAIGTDTPVDPTIERVTLFNPSAALKTLVLAGEVLILALDINELLLSSLVTNVRAA